MLKVITIASVLVVSCSVLVNGQIGFGMGGMGLGGGAGGGGGGGGNLFKRGLMG